MTKKWLGTWPASCGICEVGLDCAETFYDARTERGPWGLLCPECFRAHGVGLGTGKGQEYDTETLIKIGG